MKCLLYWKDLTAETEQNTKLPQAFTIADIPERLYKQNRSFLLLFYLCLQETKSSLRERTLKKQLV